MPWRVFLYTSICFQWKLSLISPPEAIGVQRSRPIRFCFIHRPKVRRFLCVSIEISKDMVYRAGRKSLKIDKEISDRNTASTECFPEAFSENLTESVGRTVVSRSFPKNLVTRSFVAGYMLKTFLTSRIDMLVCNYCHVFSRHDIVWSRERFGQF